jgi:hypothetical protein
MTTDTEKRDIPSETELLAGVEQFEKYERRRRLYQIANRLVSEGFQADDHARITDGLCVLLASWHARYYMAAGGFASPSAIETTVRKHEDTLATLRNRSIISLNTDGEPAIENLFRAFLSATAGPSDRTSSVAVAKTLHLLAPAFFPLWDEAIAKAVSKFRTVPYVRADETKADAKWRHYYGFCQEQKKVVAEVEGRGYDLLTRSHAAGKSTLKILDEYNYARFVLNDNG